MFELNLCVRLPRLYRFSLPRLYSVTIVMVLVYGAFAILMMALFAKVKYGAFLNSHGNFQSFGVTMVTLFRAMTGENWNGISR